jgi:hypothetical protein
MAHEYRWISTSGVRRRGDQGALTARGHSAPCHRRPHLRQSSSSTDTPLYRSIDVSGLRGPSHFQHRIGSCLRKGPVWSFTILQAYAPPREITYRRNPECARPGLSGSNHAHRSIDPGFRKKGVHRKNKVFYPAPEIVASLPLSPK